MKPEQLTSWALGESQADEALLVQASLRDDPSLSHEASEIRTFAEVIKRELKPADAALTDQQRNALKQKFMAASRSSVTKPTFQPRLLFKVLAVAACITLGLFFAQHLVSEDPAKLARPLVARKASSSDDVRVTVKSPDSKLSDQVAVGASALAAVLNNAAGAALPAPRTGALDEAQMTKDSNRILANVSTAFPLSPTGAFFSVSQAPISQFPVDAGPVSTAASLSEDLKVVLDVLEDVTPTTTEHMQLFASTSEAPWARDHWVARIAVIAPASSVAAEVGVTVEFNPARVASYRLIAYQNQAADPTAAGHQFQRGEVLPGQIVTAVYEIIPSNSAGSLQIDTLKYQTPVVATASLSEELLTAKLRYLLPGSSAPEMIEKALVSPTHPRNP